MFIFSHLSLPIFYRLQLYNATVALWTNPIIVADSSVYQPIICFLFVQLLLVLWSLYKATTTPILVSIMNLWFVCGCVDGASAHYLLLVLCSCCTCRDVCTKPQQTPILVGFMNLYFVCFCVSGVSAHYLLPVCAAFACAVAAPILWVSQTFILVCSCVKARLPLPVCVAISPCKATTTSILASFVNFYFVCL